MHACILLYTHICAKNNYEVFSSTSNERKNQVSRVNEQHRHPEEIEHAYPVDDPPDARVRAGEERVSALQEAVYEEEEADAHRRRPCVGVRVGVVLCEALRVVGVRLCEREGGRTFGGGYGRQQTEAKPAAAAASSSRVSSNSVTPRLAFPCMYMGVRWNGWKRTYVVGMNDFDWTWYCSLRESKQERSFFACVTTLAVVQQGRENKDVKRRER